MAKKKHQINPQVAEELRGLFVDSIEALKKILAFDEDDSSNHKIGNLVPRALLTERFKAKKEVALAIVNAVLVNAEPPQDIPGEANNTLTNLENALKQLAANSYESAHSERDSDNGTNAVVDSSSGPDAI